MRIFAGHDGGSGCCWYRVTVPLAELARHGHEVTFRSGGNERGNTPIRLAEMQDHDIVLGQRFNHFNGMGTWRKARTPTSRLVYEIDDDVFSVTPVNWQAFHVYSRPEIREAVMHQAQVSDLVTVTTEHLAGVMREHNANVAVLPNCVPDWLPGMERTRPERPCAGWSGGASHGADIGLIVGPVRRFLKRFPAWDFRLGGTDYRPTFHQERVLHSGWVAINADPEGYYRTLNFDIGLAPLCDTTFSRSKSMIKVLEYAALGIPSIATDCGVYREFIRHGENGFLVRRDHEWLGALSELASDDRLREKLGAQAREDAKAYAIGANWQKWETAYEQLFPRR
jgi:hypothetical protein